MNTRTMFAAASLLLTFAGASAAHDSTNVQFYDGSREELRALCRISDGTLTDGDDRTVCLDTVQRVTRVCLDDLGCYALSDYDLFATGSVAPAGSAQPFDSGHAPGVVVEGLTQR